MVLALSSATRDRDDHRTKARLGYHVVLGQCHTEPVAAGARQGPFYHRPAFFTTAQPSIIEVPLSVGSDSPQGLAWLFQRVLGMNPFRVGAATQAIGWFSARSVVWRNFGQARQILHAY